MIDWLDLVQYGGRQYVASRPGSPRSVAPAQVGGTLSVTRCRIAGTSAGPDYRFRDGDATLVPVGSTVHAIRGISPDTAVAVRRSREWLYYRAIP
ncbi:MAG: hypothetical protein ABJA34_00705 [Pseudonocardiales bacterium]